MNLSAIRARLCLMLALLPLAGGLCLSGCIRAEQTDYSAFAPAEDKRLTIYTSNLEEVYTPIIREFEERTGIWVQVENGGSIALLKQIAEESENPRCDVILGGSVESLYSFRNYFSPIKARRPKVCPLNMCRPTDSGRHSPSLP